MTIKEVVAGILTQQQADDSLRFLVCQRSRHNAMPLKWEFPGGKIEVGETPKDALRRELQEELGIEAMVGESLIVIQHEYASESAIHLTFFRVAGHRGELRNRIFEEIRWVTRGEIQNLDWLEADLPVVASIARGELV